MYYNYWMKYDTYRGDGEVQGVTRYTDTIDDISTRDI